jgi:hypothetical protein
MNLDIRMPMGIMFAVFGLILAGWGMATGHDPMYQRSLGYNINLIWGAVLLIFGSAMIYFARKSMKKD